MTRRRKILIGLAGVLALGAGWYLTRPADIGQGRFFADQTYHFQTLRALSDIPFDGADTAEVLETVKHITAGDADSWFAAWEHTGDRVAAMGRATRDPVSRGRALLRAHNYYRTAEFLLAPDDPRRPPSWKKNVDAFYEGIDTLGVTYERIKAPYGDKHLNALYFPGPAGAEQRPLIVIGGGYDSTLEELYFMLAAAAYERGYSVLAYEGPGQGSVLRDQGLVFTHEWEKPTGAVIDAFLAAHPRPPKMVLVGVSLGGYLAPRAAAFDDRFDGVVAFDVFFDVGVTARAKLPGFAQWLRRNGFDGPVEALIDLKTTMNPGFKWAVENGMWVLGTKGPLETLDAFAAYTLEPVASRIKADVLILAGADDHFVPVAQVGQFEKALTQARSVTSVIYDRDSGGAEHCQLGAQTLWHATFFDWLLQKFPVVAS
ncbi:alpha/beta fold hydrolase [Oleomonas cavernae]|uniref:Alpha/beta fold hydrolase n=1 Tax=Oleomonas cavernae TaxID=2320859 RepID=A0A418W9D8_9PROT|nr:alpha/beta fold hydrolase [Oleomonas cavernae]RJF86635.1 alpha/beta fold hydrolase [Oleomonas cavernae]